MTDWIFAFFHLFLVLAVLGYGLWSLARGNVGRFLVILIGLTFYYFIVLHKAVRKEIRRKREEKRKGRPG